MVSTYEAFDKFVIEPPFVQVFAAPRRSGKTHLINKLLEHNWRSMFDYIVIASPTLEYKSEYPDELKGNVEVIKIRDNIVNRVTQIIDEQKDAAKKHEEDPGEFDRVQTLLILDDCLDTELMQWQSANNIADVVAERGRHFDLSFVCSVQVLSKISPSVRRNAEAIFTFSPLNFTDVERILEEYVPREYRKEFRNQFTMDLFSEPYSFVLIDASPERRQNFKLRLRKGFSELIFALDPKDDDFKPQFIKGPEKTSRDITDAGIPDTAKRPNAPPKRPQKKQKQMNETLSKVPFTKR